MTDIPFPFGETWFLGLSGLIIGLILGSFTTMLSYRVPRHISIVTPPSQCPNCNTPLRTRDLLPVLSWLVEKGRCRHCQSPISLRYLLIELVTTISVLMAFLIIGFRPSLIVALIGIVAFVTLVTINVERKIGS